MGQPTDYAELRRVYFGDRAGPGPAPQDPAPLQSVLDEFAERIAPHTLNSYHPRALSYFTPPPLVASIVGEVLAQWTNQGVDVWHAGPVAAFVEEEVVRWLCDLVGYGEGSFGLLASGGVMANFIAMALVRDVHLRALTGASKPPRGAALEGVRVYASDQTHFSIARALDELGFPPETLVSVPSDDRFRLHAAPVAEAIARDRAAGLRPVAIAAVAGSTNTGSVDLVPELADLARARGPVAPRRRRLRRRRPAVGQGQGPRPGPRPRGQRDHRPAQVVLPGLRRRRAGRPRWAPPPGHLRPLARVLPRRRGPGRVGRRRPRRRPRRPAQLLQARVRGHPPVPRPEAVGDVEAPRDQRPRAADRGQRRRRRLPRQADAPRPTTSRPSPRTRSSASCASATCPAAGRPPRRCRRTISTPTRTASPRRSRRRATAGSRRPRSTARPGSAPGVVNYLTTEADIDRLLGTLRRLA